MTTAASPVLTEQSCRSGSERLGFVSQFLGLLLCSVRSSRCRHSVWSRIMASLHSALRISPCKSVASGGMRAGKQPGASRPPGSKYSGYRSHQNPALFVPTPRLGTHRNRAFARIIALFNSLAPWAASDAAGHPVGLSPSSLPAPGIRRRLSRMRMLALKRSSSRPAL
jgi:hypothetical protein